MNLGLYGTLLDPDVRALVLGQAWRNAGRPGVLHGWARFYVQGEVYPGIRHEKGGAIDVLVLDGVGPEALAAADAFEGGEYRRELLDVALAEDAAAACSAMFYIPHPWVSLESRAWHFDADWRARHRAAFLREATVAMHRQWSEKTSPPSAEGRNAP